MVASTCCRGGEARSRNSAPRAREGLAVYWRFKLLPVVLNVFFGVSVVDLLEEPEKPGKPGPVPKLERQISKVRRLSPAKQRMVSKILEATLQG